MWPFRRKAETAATPGLKPEPAPIIRHDWAALPPIQRSIGEHPLTASSDRFSNDLATHQDPSVMDQRMGHQVSAEAPAGIVLTVATPAASRRDGPTMIHRPPVQRRAAGADDVAIDTGEWNPEEAEPIEARPAPVPAPVQRLPAVERPVVAPVAASDPLTALPREAEPAPVVSRRRETVIPNLDPPRPLQRSAVEEVAAPPRLTLGQARRLGLGAPIKRVPERASVQRSTAEPAAIAPAHEPETRSESTARETVRDSAAEAPHATAPSLVTTPSASADPAVSVSRLSTVESPGLNRAPSDLPLASIAVSRRTGSEPVPATSADNENPSAAEAATPAEPRQPTGLTRPPIDRDGEAPSSAAQAGLTNAPATSIVQRTVSALTSSVVAPSAQRALTTPAALAPIAPLVGSRPMTSRPFFQRSPEPESRVEPNSIEEAIGPGFARDQAAFTVNRNDDTTPDGGSLRHSLPTGATPTIQRYTASAPVAAMRGGPVAASEARTLLPTVTRAAVARPSAPAARATADEGSSIQHEELPLAPTVVMQRAADGASAESPVWAAPTDYPSIQRSWFDGLVPGLSASAPSADGPASGSAGPGAATAAGDSMVNADRGDSESEMDELAGKLYERIRSRLRSELIADRERAGLLTDWR